jgi:DNA-binding GntR family transcriptional regulator
MDDIQIDRDSFEPAYLQLINILRRQISQGHYRSGDRLPSESQLCKSYQVSPMTVRRAINALIEQGVVRTVQGRGTFVSPLRLSKVTFGLDGLRALFNEGEATQVKIIEASILKADEKVSEKLRTPPGSRVILIRRLISKHAEPWIYHREYLVYDPRRPVVEGEMEVASLGGLFSGGMTADMKWGTFSVQATILSEEEARIMGLAPGRPAFHLEHIFFDYDEKPVSWGGFICRGDRFHFTTTVGVLDECGVG